MIADELDDGEFWLLSEILTDDDILMDLDLPSTGSFIGLTESETDEDDIVAGLTRHLARSAVLTHSPAPSKIFLIPFQFQGVNLSSSPQSTLCGFPANHGTSSRGSPVGPISPPPAAGKDDEATWDLLYKAAGEVARMKLRSETASSAKVGTGFFDCSTKRPFCPAPQSPTTTINNNNYPSIHYPQLHFPRHSHTWQQQQQYNNRVVTGRENMNKSSSSSINRPLGLPPSAWPPLQTQKQQPITCNGPAMFMGQQQPNQPKRLSVGTGVFLPRRPSETSKKSEINGVKARSGKGGVKTQQQKPSRLPAANPMAIQLPQEWTY